MQIELTEDELEILYDALNALQDTVGGFNDYEHQIIKSIYQKFNDAN